MNRLGKILTLDLAKKRAWQLPLRAGLLVAYVATQAWGREADPAYAKWYVAYQAAKRAYRGGNYKEAEKQCKLLLELARLANDSDYCLAYSYSLLGKVYTYAGEHKWAEAVKAHKQALALTEKRHGRDSPEICHVLSDIGNAYRRWGKWAKAEAAFRRQLEILTPTEKVSKRYPGGARHDLFLSYCNQGKYAQAEGLYRELCRRVEKSDGKDSQKLKWPLRFLTQALAAQGKYDKALGCVRREIKILELSAQAKRWAWNAKANLGELHELNGEYETAEKLYGGLLNQAESLPSKRKKDAGWCIKACALGLARAAIQRDDLAQAKAYCRRALAASSSYDKDEVHLLLWLIQTRMGQHQEANKELTTYASGREKSTFNQIMTNIIELFLGNKTTKEVLDAAKSKDKYAERSNLCRATYFIGCWHLANGRAKDATRFLRDCSATRRRFLGPSRYAQMELESLRQKEKAKATESE